MTMLNIHMLREAQGLADARGDRALYPKYWNGSADAEFAVYAVAMGYAQPLGDWPEDIKQSVASCAAIVEALRAEGVEPTQDELTTAVINLGILAAAAEAESEQAAAEPAVDAPVVTSEPDPAPATSPKARRK